MPPLMPPSLHGILPELRRERSQVADAAQLCVAAGAGAAHPE
jgi:hypothetical protein